MSNEPKQVQVDPMEVLNLIQQRFPKEYEICVQQAYIVTLEKQRDAAAEAMKESGVGADA